MKQGLKLLVVGIIAIMLCACGHEVDMEAWQEQYDLGIRYLFDGEYEEAIIAFEQAIEIAPRRSEAYIGASDAYRGTANTEKALQLLENVLEFEDTLPDVYRKLADIYIELADYENAIAILEKGIEKTDDAELKNFLDTIKQYLNQEDVPLTASNAHINFQALDAHRGQVSLTIDNFPLKIYCHQERLVEGMPYDNNLDLEFSDGNKQTFSIATHTAGIVGEIDYPQSQAVHSRIAGPYRGYDNGIHGGIVLEAEQCVVSRTGNTLIWHFTTPEWSYDLRNTRYISYQLPQSLLAENEDVHSIVYEIKDNGELRQVEDGHVLHYMGFVMTPEEERALREGYDY